MEGNDCLSVEEEPESPLDNIVVGGPQKIAHLYGTVVPGEAPESDDDDERIQRPIKTNKDGAQFIYNKGQHNEDDCDEDSCSSASEAFTYITPTSVVSTSDRNMTITSASYLKYNTLLHKKLSESNLSLKQEMSNLLNRPLVNAVEKLNAINQHLLTSQVEIQDAVSAMQRSYATLSKIDDTLGAVLAMNYIPNINIVVPPKNNSS